MTDTTPMLQNRQMVESWHRYFEDYLRKHNLLNLVLGSETCPVPRQGARVYELKQCREDVKEYKERKRKAFVAVCESVSKDVILYASRELDDLRKEASPDPNIAYKYIMSHFRTPCPPRFPKWTWFRSSRI